MLIGCEAKVNAARLCTFTCLFQITLLVGGYLRALIMAFQSASYFTLNSVDSTNNYAANLLRVSTPPNGSVITARFQTNGRGQRGSAWQSDADENVLMSLICYPTTLLVSDQFFLTKAAAIAVADAVRSFGVNNVSVKWPNDIYVGDQKIAGMLIENTVRDQRLTAAIIGVGLNVNQTQFHLLKATSLHLLTGVEFEVKQVVERISAFIEQSFIRLMSGQFSKIDAEYRRQLYRREVVSEFLYKDQRVTAMITGVDGSGKLIIQHPDGSALRCDLKEIVFL